MKKVYHLQSRTNEKRQHFAIRRWKIGVASIAIFASVFLAGNVLAQADETHSVENSSLSSTLASVANPSHIASTREDASDKLVQVQRRTLLQQVHQQKKNPLKRKKILLQILLKKQLLL